jgi:hypothetical protein
VLKFKRLTYEGKIAIQGGYMMHQRIDSAVKLNDRPLRDEIIDKDEIIGLIIDLETLSPDDLDKKYFRIKRRKRR